MNFSKNAQKSPEPEKGDQVVLKISGEFSLIHEIALKMAQIDGEIPTNPSKNVNYVIFLYLTGKYPLIYPQLSSILQFNRKISGYYTKKQSDFIWTASR